MSFEPENPLEKALVSAMTEPLARPEFYRLLLDSQLYIIGQLADRTHGAGEVATEPGDRLMIATVEYKGHHCHPVFSALTRLKAFAEGDVQFLAMVGRALFGATKGAHFLLNPASECGKELSPDELASILDANASQQVRALVGKPAVYPQALVDALSALFVARPEVKAAYLIEIAFEGRDERPHPMIGVEAEGDWQHLSQAIGEVLKNTETDSVVDMIPIDRAHPTGIMQALLNVPPFYSRA